MFQLSLFFFFSATGEPNIYRKPPIYKRHGSVLGPPSFFVLAVGHWEICAGLVLDILLVCHQGSV